ncbi:general secretion pathway protein GspB [Shewanella psychropiezotolerans]|uniref:General secretion pathway protein GspB n=1 Tax=Shewanella psychropiezotolerans TaxID=2593655 RepID=A0ABX5X283_9GAMM|nr:general secretion pathway protein GspB [Shewanella psychropiezotolerans]QDO85459.1 general secretion pathway protein GspB [Shewanella psychropiezotolerans]
MSILLDAVTRAKSQELDVRIDPVLTPRAQYDNFSGNSLRNLTVLFGGLIVILLIIIAWLGQIYLVGDSSQVSEPKLAQPLLQEPKEMPATSSQLVSLENEQSVRLAGKVALPVATERPRAEGYLDNRSQQTHSAEPSGYVDNRLKSQASQYVEPASTSTSTNSLAGEPIMLGANANQKGQDMLAALKFEVNQAASEVGLETGSATPKNYQDENNLLAAFEAALKAVEVKNSLAAPMTSRELDPIPATKSDTLPKYGQLPAGLQLQVPEFNINAHVYSTNSDNRWLNVDGAELQEGDKIGGKLEIVEIRPSDVVLSIQGTKFKVPAI